ncbi:hypothetical protein [Nostoc sp. CHAB 5715]|uniref:hypothetical protein n=1 Tax=Nostoc sp. CHAB 5715 TaxID=2780400 RepID=UPI001E2EB63F|nr:hypothetical protein [Nostoc sp. CHAB 5715]MCC5625211.1 hypothetical protein [Nostoc sp. CHAB 5715]
MNSELRPLNSELRPLNSELRPLNSELRPLNSELYLRTSYPQSPIPQHIVTILNVIVLTGGFLHDC